MSESEKQDFRSTRQELSFELSVASTYSFPEDFDLRVIRDFCDSQRLGEKRSEWSDEEILIDRKLLRNVDGAIKPLNSLILLAAKDPSLTIPGCRVRVQRFSGVTEGSGESYSPIRDQVIEGNLNITT